MTKEEIIKQAKASQLNEIIEMIEGYFNQKQYQKQFGSTNYEVDQMAKFMKKIIRDELLENLKNKL